MMLSSFLRPALFSVLICMESTWAAQPISSPEGTVTTYVTDHGPLVYAPRAARAQKVVFDTPEKQLVYAPDTPFRRFFDSRAPDFDPAQLEYAKTTILGDILAKLRSREYIRALVREVIEKYRDEAISDATYEEQFQKAAGKLLEGLSKSDPDKVEKAARAMRPLIEQHPDPTKKAELEATVDSASKQLSEAIQMDFFFFSDVEEERVEAGVKKVLTENAPDHPAPTDAQRRTWRSVRTELLQDLIYLKLLENNYPALEDDEVKEIFAREIATHDIWRGAVLGPKVHDAAIQAMQMHLVQKFQQRDWLRQVVDEAVLKRLNLFKKAGSPVDSLREAETAFGKFLDQNLFSASLSASAREEGPSLWQAFLKHANTTNSPTRFLLQPYGGLPGGVLSRNMSVEELKLFGADLRPALLKPSPRTGLPQKLDELKETLWNYFSSGPNTNLLCPEFELGKTADAVKAELKAKLSDSVKASPAVKAAFSSLTSAMGQADSNATEARLSEFLAAVADAFRTANAQILPDDQVPSAFLEVYTNRIVTPALPKVNVAAASLPKLDDLIDKAVVDPLPLNTSRAKRRIVQDFTIVFGDRLDLLSSDEPILAAFLGSEAVKFASPDFRKKAISLVPSRVYTKTNAPTKTEDLKAAFRAAVEDPEVSFYFSGGWSNPHVVDAFKQEFYSRFHDPKELTAAIEAEKDADYEYWWLSFYPKALPLGNRKLEGESIIEVAFPDAVVPQPQYHRWLQDTSLSGKGVKEYAQGGKAPATGTKTSPPERTVAKEIPGGIPESLELRNATALLRDTLNVLEASELTESYGEVRPVVLRALDAFTNMDEKSEDKRYRRGIRALCEEILSDGEMETIDRIDQHLARCGNAVSAFACPFCGGAAAAIVEPADFEQAIKERVHNISLQFYAKQKLLKKQIAELRENLRFVEFSREHLLFSVISISETKARLPEKINLYAWAGSQGSLLFTLPKKKVGEIPRLENYLVRKFNELPPDRGDNVLSFNEIGDAAYEGIKAEGDLYQLIVNAYFSKYPDVPSKASIREAYFDQGNSRLRPLTYQFLDHYGALSLPSSQTLLKELAKKSPLTPRAQKQLFEVVANNIPVEPAKYRYNLANAVNTIFQEEKYSTLVSELEENLFDFYFGSVWQMCSMIEQTERRPAPFVAIEKEEFRRFRSWARPALQKGIQVVEMLPATRDDLVSISVNEGGMIAKVAAQGDVAAAYDMNELKMAQRIGSVAGSKLEKMLEQRRLNTTNLLSTAQDQFDETSAGQKREVFRDMARLGKQASSGGYSLGATGTGSAYARARAAMAYSRRREYLDAAITAAGRGDNIAKWIVRKSDVRSELAKQGGKKLVAAAHNGFPNGDQPFHLLVKIPRRAMRTDWENRKYIYFNSTYVATRKISFWRAGGFPGLVVKTPLALINPHWWNNVEEGLVGTQFPFMWDVRDEGAQMALLREPNFLGGEIWLDDTDKIKHSEILDMINAEDAFIRVTRETQNGELTAVMKEVEKEAGDFKPQVRQKMRDEMANADNNFNSNNAAIANRILKLEEDLNTLKNKLNPTSPNSSSPAGSSTNAPAKP